MKKTVALIVIVVATNKLLAQVHYEDWNKISISKNFNKKISTIFDVNFRQQANYKHDEKNPFHLPLMRSERLWLFYNFKNNNSIVGSFFYANANDILDEKATMSSSQETQVNLGFFNKSSSKKIIFRSRILFEKRQINSTNTSINQFRYRFMELITIPIKSLRKKQYINCVLFNEAFFKTQQSITSFDQNRLSALLQWHFPSVEYNVGFQKTYQNQNDNLTERNQLLFNVFLVL